MTKSIKLILSTCMVWGSVATYAQCVPHDNQAAFAVDENFQGGCVILDIGEYPTATSTHLPNDSISSIRVGANVQVYACQNENFGGLCAVIQGNHPTLTATPIGNDSITSVKVQAVGTPPPCNPGPLQVALYMDANFGGTCRLLPVGDYPTATSTGLPNDSVSSIRVGAGAQVTVCHDEYYGGTCVLLTGSTSYLGNTAVGNDQLTSAKVRALGASDFDARCTDPHATGRFSCRIEQPDVTHAETNFSKVVFSPGDTVYVDGDGCVQTGSHLFSGSTWKRYVNPTGGDADHLYHGLVRIPGGVQAGTDVGNSLTRIEHVVGRPIQVVGDGLSTAELQLHLGYEDDGYGDNGYNDHDDGTEDQCKTASTNYGGPAFVTVTICRGTSPCEAPASRFPFNVRSDEFDPNGFLYNPHWSWQERPENRGMSPVPTPITTLCHYMAMSSIAVLGLWAVPNIPDCSDQAGTDTFNQPSDASPNNAWCTAGLLKDGGFSGHINWFPVTVKGEVGRVSHDIDDDWDFSFPYENPPGTLYYDHVDDTRHYLHSEFDSEETVDQFRSDGWTELHDAIDDRENKSDLLHACQQHAAVPPPDCSAEQAASDAAWTRADQLFTGDGIITGLFGIDGEHGEKSELHPVYAIAINQKRNCQNNPCQIDPTNDVWLMFVRNRGDEGFCSDNVWDAGFTDYTFRLPWLPGMSSVDVLWDKTQFEGSDGTSTSPDVRIVPPQFIHGMVATDLGRAKVSANGSDVAGIYVSFHLGSSDSNPFVDGALHLVWSSSGSTPSPPPVLGGDSLLARRVTTQEPGEDTEDAQDVIQMAIDHLAPPVREDLKRSRKRTVTLRPRHLLSRGTVRYGGLAGTSVAAARAKGASAVAGRAGTASAKLARDAALTTSVCKATDNAPYGVPKEVCSAQTIRDHRAKDPRRYR
jgi:hypothetical protein